MPRNFQTSPVKMGKVNDAYLNKPEFHTIGDPYAN
jgi:hypothetical protein